MSGILKRLTMVLFFPVWAPVFLFGGCLYMIALAFWRNLRLGLSWIATGHTHTWFIDKPTPEFGWEYKKVHWRLNVRDAEKHLAAAAKKDSK